MTTLDQLIHDLQSLGIRMWADGDKLRCSSPKGAMTAELRDRISAQKADLLSFLAGASAQRFLADEHSDEWFEVSKPLGQAWFSMQLAEGGSIPQAAVAVKIRARLDSSKAHGCLEKVLRPHEVLRLEYRPSREGVRARLCAERPLPFRVLQAGNQDLEDEARRAIAEELRLTAMVRALFVHGDRGEFVCAVLFPRTAMDCVSARSLLDTAARRYLGEEAAGTDCGRVDVREPMDADPGSNSRAGDLASPQVSLFQRATGPWLTVDTPLPGIDPNYLLAAYAIVLHRLSGSDRFLMGLPWREPRWSGKIGPFTQILPVAIDCSGDPAIQEVVKRILCSVERSMAGDSPAAFTRCAFSFDPNGPAPAVFSSPAAHGCDLEVSYCVAQGRAAISSNETAARLFAGMLECVAAQLYDPARRLSALSLASPEVSTASSRAPAEPRETVVDLFEAQAISHPDTAAAVWRNHWITFGELRDRVQRMAAILHARGVRPETRIAVCMERSLEMLMALLAVLRAGAAYVPLDPSYPEDRLRMIAKSAGIEFVLTSEGGKADLWPEGVRSICVEEVLRSACAPDRLPPLPCPEQLAYVIYTSGSTGTPKGVEITHAALANAVRFFAREVVRSPKEMFLAVTTISFDISALELFLPVATGGCAAIAEREDVLDGRRLAGMIARLDVSTMQATPAGWKLLASASQNAWPNLRAICGGEALDHGLAAGLKRRSSELWNVYGPTETTIWSTAWRVDEGIEISIGGPVDRTRVHILDRCFGLLPPLAQGEIYIAGLGVARGYSGRPSLTADRFLPDPYGPETGARMYRTGDSGWQLACGEFVCAGRIDNQLKLRGFRIEPAEIEAVLRLHPAVTEAAVVKKEARNGAEEHLAAYVTFRGPANIDELRELVRAKLPTYMAPAAIVPIDEMPRTPNGKLDRRRLVAMESARSVEAPPQGRSALEALVASAWEQELGVSGIANCRNFFDVGGNSFSAMRVHHRLETSLGHRFELVDLFRYATIESLAAHLASLAAN